MITEVIMKRDFMGDVIRQKSKTEFFSATDLEKIGSKFRKEQKLSKFNVSMWLKTKNTQEFIRELSLRYGNVISITRGHDGGTWVHPMLFIKMAMAINPKFEVQAIEWLYDQLIKYRNESGDTFKEMSGSLYHSAKDKRHFPHYIQRVSNYIKKSCGVSDWQSATTQQLKLRDDIHKSIKLLCNVIDNPDQAVILGVQEHTKNLALNNK